MEPSGDSADERTRELLRAYNLLQSRNDEINRELDMARRVQLRMLPQDDELPRRPEIAAAGWYGSMGNVGGDLWDVVRIGRNAYALLMADVSGHGVPAALVTALAKVAFRSNLHWNVSPAEVCSRVNEQLYPLLSDIDHYVTAFLGIFDLEAGRLDYTNCGHHPGLLLRVREDLPVQLDTRGRFLGAFEDIKAETISLALEPLDTLLLYTDGVIESRDLADREWGLEGLTECLLETGIDDPAALVGAVRQSMEAHALGTEPRDDRTLAAAQFRATCPREPGPGCA